jgi:hypothetical protein
MIFRQVSKFLRWLFGGGKKMPKKPEVVDIEVIVTSKGGGPCDVDFELGHVSKAGTAGDVTVARNPASAPRQTLTFKNKEHPGFIVLFNIVDRGRTGIQFLPDPDDAMWVQPSDLSDPPCPTSPAYRTQFMAIDIADDRVGGNRVRNQTLVVSNKNTQDQMFGFTLRFEIPGCPTVVEFDPIGNDQNGQRY